MAKDVDWKKLRHRGGPATRIPANIKDLTAKSLDKRDDALTALEDALVGQGQWFGASAPAVALLLDAIASAPEPDLVCLVAADVIGADHVRAWLSPPDAPIPQDAAAVHDEAIARKDAILGLARSSDPRSRAGATLLLAVLAELRGDSVPLLLPLAERDPDRAVRAGALLALARLCAGTKTADAVIATGREAEDALVRGAATVAWLRVDPARSFADAKDGIASWLSWDRPRAWTDEETLLSWFGGRPAAFYWMRQPLPPAAKALVELARSRGATDALVDALLSIGRDLKDGTAERQTGKALLDLGGFLKLDNSYVALPAELSADQKKIAAGLADTMLPALAGHGLAAAGAVRKRWLGLAPAGPLEKEISIELDGKKVTLPLWSAWKECYRHRLRGNAAIPPLIDQHLAGLDRWQAAAEFDPEPYGAVCAMKPEQIEELYANTPRQGDELVSRAEKLADEVSARFEAALRQGAEIEASATTSALILLPIVRAKRPIAQRWENLVHIGGEPQSREVFAALAPERREAVVVRYMDWYISAKGLSVAADVLESVMSVLDLTPSPGTLAAFSRHLQALEKRDANSVRDLLSKLETLAKKHPALKAAIPSKPSKKK